MRAFIYPDLMDRWESFFGPEEGHRTDPDAIALADRIAGREVTLVFTTGDAFEEEDDNYWLPPSCWMPLPTPPETDQ